MVSTLTHTKVKHLIISKSVLNFVNRTIPERKVKDICMNVMVQFLDQCWSRLDDTDHAVQSRPIVQHDVGGFYLKNIKSWSAEEKLSIFEQFLQCLF